ncbi:MAG: hypothetical protein E7Z83_02225 [Methanobrevibacter sp.]|nr:NAD/NADP-dependent octopine/nopaline dehydrogenase family protein [Methanobrevibacter sp.]MBE6489655.1 hypothetical protein [Methanobrevibacter sp.]
MKVTVIGGGNIGTLLAAELSFQGFDTYIYSSKNEGDYQIKVFDNQDNFLFESNDIVFTQDIENAVKNSKFIFVTYPPELFVELSKMLDGLLNEGVYLGIIPGSGGVEFVFNNLINNGVILFGFQRVHSIARIKEPGRSVYMLGRKESIYVSVFRNKHEKIIKDFLENLLNMPCHILENYLTITLNPSNQILHTARLCSMFKGYKPGVTFSKNILFYATWDDESSDLLIRCDEELQMLCDAISFDLSGVKSLKEHYESYTIQDMTKKISNIEAFKNLTSPMITNDDGLWIPNFKSRYFASDFPYGLKIIIDIAKLYGTPTNNLEHVWNWFLILTNTKRYFSLKDFGISSKEEFEDYYNGV